MMRTIAAFGMTDLRSVRRDSLMVYMLVFPWLAVVLVRVFVPAITAWLANDYSFDLVPYYPLLLSFFFILEMPLLFGAVLGLLVLDERDADTLTALQVTPVSMTSYASYRIGVAMLLSVFYVLISLPLTGFMPLSLLPAVVPIALLSGLLAPFFALLLVSVASNKVEGMAVMKGFGIFMLGPLVAYFVDPTWQVLVGLLPTFWPAKAFWVVSAGGGAWPYVVVGAIYNVLLLIWLLRRFQRKLYQQ